MSHDSWQQGKPFARPRGCRSVTSRACSTSNIITRRWPQPQGLAQRARHGPRPDAEARTATTRPWISCQSAGDASQLNEQVSGMNMRRMCYLQKTKMMELLLLQNKVHPNQIFFLLFWTRSTKKIIKKEQERITIRIKQKRHKQLVFF